MGRIFAIPDIHGRYDLLKQLLTKLSLEEKLDIHCCGDSKGTDKLVFLGDYVDRGPDSDKVILTIRHLVDKNPGRVIALAGNHEWLMIDAMTKKSYDDTYLWIINGGSRTLWSYGVNFTDDGSQVAPGSNEQIESDIKWMASLPLFHVEQSFFFSHAPILSEKNRPGHLRFEPLTKQDYIWSYDDHEADCFRKVPGQVGVCGHIHQVRSQLYKKEPLSPRFYDDYIFADAGAGCHELAPLVAIEVISRKVIYSHPQGLTKLKDSEVAQRQ